MAFFLGAGYDLYDFGVEDDNKKKEPWYAKVSVRKSFGYGFNIEAGTYIHSKGNPLPWIFLKLGCYINLN